MKSQKILVIALSCALVSILACKKKADVKPDEAAKALEAAPKTLVAPAKELGALPPGVMAAIGMKSLDGLRATAKAASEGLGPLVDAEDLEREMKLPPEIEKALDPTRPIFVVFSFADGEPQTSAIVPVKDMEAAKAAAQAGIGDAHLELLDGWVIRSDSAAVMAQHRPLLDKARGDWKPAATVQILLSGKAVVDAARPAFDAIKSEIAETMKWGMMASAMPMDPEQLVAFYAMYLDGLLSIMSEVSYYDIRLDADGERFRFELLAEVAEGGALRKAIINGEKGGVAAAGLLPPEAWAVFAADLDPKLFESLKVASVKLLTALMKDAPSYEVETAFNEIYEVQTGDSAVALYADQGFPFAMAGAVLTTDGEKYQKALTKMSDLYLRWAESAMGKMGPGAPPVDFSSWTRLFEGMSAFTGAFGLKMAIEEDGDVAGLRVNVNWDSLGAMSGDSSEMARNKKLYGEKWEMAFGFGPAVASAAFGPSGFAAAQKVLEGSWTYKDEAFEASIKRGAANPFFIVWLDLGRAQAAFADIAENALMAFDAVAAQDTGKKLRAAKAGQPVAFTIGGSGQTLQVVFELPFAPIRELGQLFR